MIVPLLEKFNAMFPELVKYNLTQNDLDGVQGRVIGFISNVEGEINLSLALQTQGVYLATAHVLFLLKNPDKTGGRLTSATEGGVSAGFQPLPVNSIRDWSLGRTEYGLDLIRILQQVQPPLPEKDGSPVPYYGAGGLRNGGLRLQH